MVPWYRQKKVWALAVALVGGAELIFAPWLTAPLVAALVKFGNLAIGLVGGYLTGSADTPAAQAQRLLSAKGGPKP